VLPRFFTHVGIITSEKTKNKKLPLYSRENKIKNIYIERSATENGIFPFSKFRLKF